MNIGKKWGAAAAALLTVALVAGGTATANAAPGDPSNPQPNGSPGAFFLFDGDIATAEQEGRVFDRADFLSASSSKTDPAAPIVATTYVPAWGTTVGDSVYKFVAKANEAAGGTNVWRAYDKVETGTDGAVAWEDFTLETKTQANGAGIESVFTEGGDWITGLAFTNAGGATVYASVYRTIHVAVGTGKYTIDPVVIDAGPVNTAPAVTTQPAAKTVVEEGANATFTAAASGTPAPTVQWESNTGSGWSAVAGATTATLTVSGATLAQNGAQYRAVFTNSAGSATTNAAILAVHPTEPVAGDAGEATIDDPAEGNSTIQIPVAAAYNGQSLSVWAWSTPTQLPNAPVVNGVASVDISSLAPGEHTVAIQDPSTGEVIAWTTFTIAEPTNVTVLTVDVLTSNKFALEGLNAAVDLGEVKRGKTTVAAPLTPFTVTDDRTNLPGWNLTAAVDDFVNDGIANPAAAGDTISKAALGLKPKHVGTAVVGVAEAAEQVAGAGVYNALFAEGAANSSTGEAGTQFDADLTFAAPLSAKAGTYTSKLTLTLTSK